MVHADISLGKSKCIRSNRASSRCAPIHYVLQEGNREQFSSGICVCTRVQSSLQPDKGSFQEGRAKVDHNKAGYGGQMESLPTDARGLFEQGLLSSLLAGRQGGSVSIGR
jgi:hypothetical protein